MASACVLALGACAPVGPDFVPPDAGAPAQWQAPVAPGFQTSTAEATRWWRVFSDPVLDELIEMSLRGNNNLEIAGLRVLEARAQLGIATGQQYPQSQLASGGATYLSPPDNSGIRSNYWQYAFGTSAVWEIDFWGRFRRGIESADAAYLASIAAYDQAMVLLTAQLVDTYTVLRATEEQLRISRENVKLQQRSYDIAEVLYRNGSDSELDMQQAQTLLLATKATIPGLEVSLKQARNALSTLVGLPPGSLADTLAASRSIPAVPEQIAIGFPADMLRRRPDVRQAELQAKAQNALIGFAKADLYPSFSLAGSIGLAAGSPGDSDFGDLFDADALTFSIGPSFVWPFLNYGRIKNNVRVQDARLQQALVNFRETVLQAAREAEDAMAGFIGARAQAKLLAETVVSAKRSNELSTLRYQEGFSDYQRVLDAQQALFTQQQRHIGARGDTVRNLVALYRSLGHGWETESDLPQLDAATLDTMQQRSDWGRLLEESTPQADDNQEVWRKPDW